MIRLCVLLVALSVCLSTEAAQDFARHKPASMNSALNSSYGADKAVDGDSSTYMHTAYNQSYAWWRVDLEEVVTSPNLRISFKISYGWPRDWYKLVYYGSEEYFPSPNSSFWSPPTGGSSKEGWVSARRSISGSISMHGRMRYVLIYTADDISGQGAVLKFNKVEIMACPEGFYGDNCSRNCSSRGCNGTSICPYDSGYCENRCRPNFFGFLADCSECWPSYYGENCEKLCKTRGCMPDYSTDRCPRDGTCYFGCRYGFTGPDCSDCDSGRYGEKCQLKCSERACKGHSSCTRNGTCDNGCRFTGPTCSECPPGLYGVNCSQNCSSRNCEDDSPCSRHSFSCSCKSGWIGDDCTEACRDGTYGKNCSKLCEERNCSQPSNTCDGSEGRCPGGCGAGYQGVDCTENCPEGDVCTDSSACSLLVPGLLTFMLVFWFLLDSREERMAFFN